MSAGGYRAGGYRAVKKEGTQALKLHSVMPPPTPSLPLHQPPVSQKLSNQSNARQPMQKSLPMAAAAAPGGWLAVLSDPVANISCWVPQQPSAALGYGLPSQGPLSAVSGMAMGLADLPAAPQISWMAGAAATAAVCSYVTTTAADARLFCNEQLDMPGSSTPADETEPARRTSAASCQDAWHPWASQQTQQATPQHAALRPAAILRHSARLSMPPQPATPVAGLPPTPQRPLSPSMDDDLIASFLNDGPDSGLSSRCGFGSDDSTAARV